MAGIYFHFPFCKKACTYCNFHFSTVLKNKNNLIQAMFLELNLRKDFFESEKIESIYFGGGSPSIMKANQIGEFILKVKELFKVSNSVEITLELNPEDASMEYLEELIKFNVNRLSVGVQSFFNDDLKLINRVHDSKKASEALYQVKKVFENFSIDLIYGLPNSNLLKWKKNLRKALSFNPPHLSCYALTVEPKTMLSHQIKLGKVKPVNESLIKDQYDYLIGFMESLGYENYEFSNFSIQGKHSINNTAYWEGKSYLGIGPAAHSFDGNLVRSWNINQNNNYIKAIKNKKLPLRLEKLSKKDRYNESVMTGLRTSKGISLDNIKKHYGESYFNYLKINSEKKIFSNDLYWRDGNLCVSRESKFLTDGLASELFIL